MKRFKEFLVEEITASAISPADDVAPTIAPKPQIPSYTPSTKARKQGGSTPEVEKEEDDNENTPDWEEWFEKNPLPNRENFDENGDGVLDERELKKYQEAWNSWKRNYQRWLEDQWQGRRPDWDRNRPNLTDSEYERWLADNPHNYERKPRTPRNPNEPPPGFDKEDYQFWWNIWRQLYGRDPTSQELYDYVWGIFRGRGGELPDSWWSRQNQSGMGQ